MNTILEKAIKGDKDAFVEAVSSMERKLYLIAKSKLSNEEDIKDVIQETICQCYKNIKKLKDISKFDTWMITILINNCNQLYRKRKHTIFTLYEENDIVDIHSNNEYLKFEDNIDFIYLLNLLEKNERVIFILFYSDDYTTKQISEILKINENTIKSKLKRAREKIQKHIERCDKNERKIR